MTRPKLARDGTSCFVPRTWRSPPHRRLHRKPPSEAVTSTTAHPDLRATSKAPDPAMLHRGFQTVIQCLTSIL